MHLNFVDTKIEIFRDFWVFVLKPILKNEKSVITEIYQKPQNTEIWECSSKNSWNAVQLTSISKWSSDTAIHVPYFCLLRASEPNRFLKLSTFLLLFNSVLTLRKLKEQLKNRSTCIWTSETCKMLYLQNIKNYKVRRRKKI